jgi:DNA-binding winged helix-turn-helix (wHTH) protein
MTRSAISFGPFRLDLKGPHLSKGDESVALQKRPLAVLCYLAARPGEVVGRDELIRTLWAGTYVTRAVLKVAVHAVREALGDDADSPRYIETVGREGYRFIAAPAAAGTPGVPTPTMVGRADELAVLRTAYEQATGGARRIVFVTGEGGIRRGGTAVRRGSWMTPSRSRRSRTRSVPSRRSRRGSSRSASRERSRSSPILSGPPSSS